MSSSWRGNLDERGNKKPKIEELEDVPSSFQRPRPTCYLCDGTDGIPDGGIEDSDASKWEEKGGGKLDPLAVFGSGIMMMILSKLDARSVARSRLVCSDWRSVASSDEIWLPKTAPDYWRSLDPHWQGTGTPMRRYFHPDGSITPDSNDRVWGGHESCYTIVTGSLEDGTIRKHYVRINRWPQLSVQRKEDGSWELSNHLYCYTSIPDADKVDGTGPPFPLFS